MEYFCFLFEFHFFMFEFDIEVRCLLVVVLCFWGGRVLGFKPVSRLCCEFAGGL